MDVPKTFMPDSDPEADVISFTGSEFYIMNRTPLPGFQPKHGSF
jgi:hypothetical protein